MSSRLRLAVSGVIAGLVATVAPVLVSSGSAGVAFAGAGQVFRTDMKGGVAEGIWSDFPGFGYVVPGKVYTQTYVIGSDGLTGETKLTGNAVAEIIIDKLSFDDQGNLTILDEQDGLALGDSVSYTYLPSLGSAHLQAVIPIQDCDETGACTDAGNLTVDVRWAGYGHTYKTATHTHAVTQGFVLNRFERGTDRMADGVATVDGTSLGHTLQGLADLGIDSDRRTVLCHNC